VTNGTSVNILHNLYINIQGVSRLVDITAWGDFLGLCDQESSYKYVSDFGRLRSYGHFLIPVHALMWTTSYGTSWQVMYSTWWLIVCVALFLSPDSCSSQPSGSLCCWLAVAFSKISFKHRSIQIKGKLTLHLYFKCVMVYYFVLFIVNNRYLLSFKRS